MKKSGGGSPSNKPTAAPRSRARQVSNEIEAGAKSEDEDGDSSQLGHSTTQPDQTGRLAMRIEELEHKHRQQQHRLEQLLETQKENEEWQSTAMSRIQKNYKLINTHEAALGDRAKEIGRTNLRIESCEDRLAYRLDGQSE